MKKRRNTKKISLGRELDRPQWKVLIMGGVIILFFALVAAKAFQLQVIDRERAFEIARKQHHGTSTLLPRRGNIVDRNLKELAVNVDVMSIYTNPMEVENPADVTLLLSEKLDISQKKLLPKLSSKKSFVWVKRLVDSDVSAELEALDLKGIHFTQEPKRVYPNGHLMGQVLGFTDIDSIGIEGLEYKFNTSLIGKPKTITLKRDARGRKIINNPALMQDLNEDNISGRDIVLTIDSQIQHIVERELKEGIEEMNAEKGMAILMNPETGEVLAMASYPFVDPNTFRQFPEANRRNLPIWYMYEPGSTMKAFVVAAALDTQKVNPNTLIDCENGRRKVGRKVIKDIKPYGIISVSEILRVSSNIGASKIGELLGRNTYYSYLDKFGFGDKTGIELPGESSGKLLRSRKWGKIELATISFGQGIAVTSLQLSSALSAIANGGFLMKPYVVKQILAPDGSVIENNKPQIIRRVISYDTSYEVTRMLENVVENGTGKKARIPGISVAGKTGTAQIPNPVTGGYYSNRYIASFVGFAPANDPKITLVVVVEAPRKKTHGGSVAAPIFKKIAEKVLFHLGVTPEKELVGMKIMPDLSGMSLRDILKWSEQEGIEVKLKGSGYVTDQQPLPGDLISEGMVCSIKLQQNI